MADRVVYKNTGVEDLDDFYSRDPDPTLPDALKQADTLLENPGKARLSQAAGRFAQGRANLSNETPDQLEQAWLQDAGPRADKVMRLGYQAAVEEARAGRPDDDPLPIETFFVAGASTEFEFHICKGTRQVTVLMFMPGDRKYGSTNAASKSWVVRVGRAGPDAQVLDGDDPVVVKIQRSGKRES